MTRVHVLRVTDEELLTIQDAVDDLISGSIAPAVARLALRLHDLTGEELPPDLEQYCAEAMP